MRIATVSRDSYQNIPFLEKSETLPEEPEVNKKNGQIENNNKKQSCNDTEYTDSASALSAKSKILFFEKQNNANNEIYGDAPELRRTKSMRITNVSKDSFHQIPLLKKHETLSEEHEERTKNGLTENYNDITKSKLAGISIRGNFFNHSVKSFNMTQITKI